MKWPFITRVVEELTLDSIEPDRPQIKFHTLGIGSIGACGFGVGTSAGVDSDEPQFISMASG